MELYLDEDEDGYEAENEDEETYKEEPLSTAADSSPRASNSTDKRL